MIGGRWAWVVAWAVLIEGLLLWPHPPELPQSLSVPNFDKLVHVVLFGVQASLAVRANGPTARRWLPALVATMLFGAFTEVQQHFVPSRSMELGDFLADSVGATIGAVGVVMWARKRRELGA